MPKESSKEAIRRNPLAVWVGETVRLAQENKRALVGILAAAVVVGGGITGYAWYQDRQEREAQVLLGKAVAAAPAEKPGASPPAEEVKKQLGEVLGKFPGTIAAQESLIRIGNLQYDGGKFDDAIASFGKYLSSYPRGRFRMLAGIGKAYAEEAKGDPAAGIKTLSDVLAEGKDDPMAGEAYVDLGRLYEETKKPDEAVKVYGQVAEKFPQTRWAQIALGRMSGLKGK